jgi:hypothetical protein
MIHSIFLILALLVLIACGDNQVASPLRNNQNVGFLQGQVTIGPNCPVETQDDPCLPDPSLYASHKLLIIDASGNTVQEVRMDSSGHYRTELPSGTYIVDFVPHDIGLRGTFKPPQAQIREGQTTILNIQIDTGIR